MSEGSNVDHGQVPKFSQEESTHDDDAVSKLRYAGRHNK